MKTMIGDICTITTHGYIMHQVNCQDKMNAGVAKAIKTRWPIVAAAYHDKIATQGKGEHVFGSLQTVDVTPTLTIVNSFSQLYYGNAYKTRRPYTDETILIRNIKIIAALAASKNENLYIPKFIGCGLAGGQWSHVTQALNNLTNVVCVSLN